MSCTASPPVAPPPLDLGSGALAPTSEPLAPELRRAEIGSSFARGDLDGDGHTDRVEGSLRAVERFDSSGRRVWSRRAAKVEQVALVDADADGRPEILHTTAEGDLVLRGAGGDVRSRIHTGVTAARFAVLDGAGGPRILHHDEDRLVLVDLAGRRRTRLDAPVWNEGGELAALAFTPPGRRAPWLAVLDAFPDDAMAVLSVFDAGHRRVHDEVIAARCTSLSAHPTPGGETLAVGCDGQRHRYAPNRRSGRTVASLRTSGDALGPLRFGDTRAQVQALRPLFAAHRCLDRGCASSRVRIGAHDFMMIPEFRDGGLARVFLLAYPQPRDAHGDEGRAAWEALLRHVSRRNGPADRGEQRFPSADVVRAAANVDGWRSVETHRWTRPGRGVELGVLTIDAPGALQFAAYASIARDAGGHAMLPAAPER